MIHAAKKARRRRERLIARLRIQHRRCFVVENHDAFNLWECKIGHRFKTRIAHRFDVLLAKGYWTREGGGAHVTCPKCLRDEYAKIDERIGWGRT